MEKGTSQFCWSAGRCGAMRRGVHAGMPLGCPLPAQGVQQPRPRQPPWAGSQGMGMQQPRPRQPPMGRQPRQGHAAAKACSSPPWARSQGMGMQQPRPRQPPMGTQQARLGRARSIQGLGEHAAAKAWACTQQPRPGRACVGALACPWAQAAGPLGARRVPEGQWQHGEGVACPVGGMPRPWHALGTPRRPWQHLGGLLLPSLDSLFGHLPTLPPLKSA